MSQTMVTLLSGLCALCCHAIAGPAGQSLPIVPDAAGFGMSTPAGSGRHLDKAKTQVIKVTNLDTDGTGSLRAALEANGPRTVVFEVAGDIDFRPFGGIAIRNPYLTIAGQTAPSPGITLKGCELAVATHDVLIQHLRIRTGDRLDPNRPLKNEAGWTQWSERDCMKIDGERIVIDHCSFSWATDELVQTRARLITFRHNLFAEALASPKHHEGPHSNALLILDQGPKDRAIPEDERHSRYVAVIGNLFAFSCKRTPEASGGSSLAVINNFVYGALSKPFRGIVLTHAPRQGSRLGPIRATVTGNHFDRVRYPIQIVARNGVVSEIFLGELLFSYTDKNGKYAEKHFADPWTAPHMKIYKEWCGKPVFPLRSKVDTPPVVVPGLAIRPVREVREWVLANAGARPADRDATDRRVLAAVRSRTGKVIKSQTETPEWQAANRSPDVREWLQGDAGAQPEPPENQDSRRKLRIPPDPNGDEDGDGYTNLEEWLHAFSAEVERTVK